MYEEFKPRGPSESSRIKSIAENYWIDLKKIYNNEQQYQVKSSFMSLLKEINNNIIGIKKAKINIRSEKLYNQQTSISNSNNNDEINQQIFPIDSNLCIASNDSLEKLKILRMQLAKSLNGNLSINHPSNIPHHHNNTDDIRTNNYINNQYYSMNTNSINPDINMNLIQEEKIKENNSNTLKSMNLLPSHTQKDINSNNNNNNIYNTNQINMKDIMNEMMKDEDIESKDSDNDVDEEDDSDSLNIEGHKLLVDDDNDQRNINNDTMQQEERSLIVESSQLLPKQLLDNESNTKENKHPLIEENVHMNESTLHHNQSKYIPEEQNTTTTYNNDNVLTKDKSRLYSNDHYTKNINEMIRLQLWEKALIEKEQILLNEQNQFNNHKLVSLLPKQQQHNNNRQAMTFADSQNPMTAPQQQHNNNRQAMAFADSQNPMAAPTMTTAGSQIHIHNHILPTTPISSSTCTTATTTNVDYSTQHLLNNIMDIPINSNDDNNNALIQANANATIKLFPYDQVNTKRSNDSVRYSDIPVEDYHIVSSNHISTRPIIYSTQSLSTIGSKNKYNHKSILTDSIDLSGMSLEVN